MTDDMLAPSSMHIKSYVYDGFCKRRTNFPGPIESIISKFTCIIYSVIQSALLNYIIMECKTQNINGLLMVVDFAKAFDTMEFVILFFVTFMPIVANS